MALKPAAREVAGLLGLGLMNWLFLNAGPLEAGIWSDEAGLDTAHVGFLMTTLLVAGAIVGIGLSAYLHRVPPRQFGLAAGLALVATNLWLAWRLDFGSLVAGCMATGGLLACLNACGAAALGATGKPVRAAAITSVVGTIAIAVATIPVAHLAAEFGARGLFGAQAAVGLLGCGLTALMRDDGSRETPPQATPLLRAARSPFVASAVCMELATAGVWAFTERIGAHIGLGPDRVGDIIAAASLCGIGGSIAAALAARFGADTALAIVSTVALGLAASAIAVSSDPVWFAAMLSLQAFVFVFSGPFVSALGVKLDRSGGLVAAAHGWALLVGGAAPLVGGWLIEPARFGRLAGLGLCATALAAGSLALAAFGPFGRVLRLRPEP